MAYGAVYHCTQALLVRRLPRRRTIDHRLTPMKKIPFLTLKYVGPCGLCYVIYAMKSQVTSIVMIRLYLCYTYYKLYYTFLYANI
jgi:hypothetical protein